MPTVRSNLVVPLKEIKKCSTTDDQMETESENRPRSAFRPLCVKCGVFGAQDGSGYAEFGNTRVLAQIKGPESDGKWEESYAKVTVSLKGVDDETNARLRAQLLSSMTSLIFHNKYPGKVINIEITVMTDDGGVLAVALVASTLALAHSGINNMGLITSAHVGIMKSSGEMITDPEKNVELDGGICLGFLPNLNQIICIDTYGRIDVDKMPELIEFARKSAICLVPTLHKAILNSIREGETK